MIDMVYHKKLNKNIIFLLSSLEIWKSLDEFVYHGHLILGSKIDSQKLRLEDENMAY